MVGTPHGIVFFEKHSQSSKKGFWRWYAVQQHQRRLAACEVASCAQTAGGSTVTGRSQVSAICHVHCGARSREGVAHQPLLSIPSSQERTVERHLDVPVLPIHVSSATSSKMLQFFVEVRHNLYSLAAPNTSTCQCLFFVSEFMEVILLLPQQAQRWIAPGNRESRCTLPCSSASGGSLPQRVSSSTRGRHRKAQLRLH